MRIVIDTNIWVSGLLWKGKPWQLLKLAESGDVQLCIAHSMLLELEEVLAYDKFQSRLQILHQTPAQLATYVLSLSTAFDVSRKGISVIKDDPDDDIFVWCALSAGAKYLVTGDRHLLNFGYYQTVKMITVAEFLDLMYK